MKIILILFSTLYLLLSSHHSYAQLEGQALIDSLEAELPNAKGDTNHVKLLQNLSYTYYSINPDKGIENGNKGVELAKKIDWQMGGADSYNSLAINNAVKSDYPKALEYFLRSLEIYEELGNKSGIATALANIGSIYDYQSDYPKALEYILRSLEIYEELGDKKGIADALSNIGIIYDNQSDYPKALKYYMRSLEIREELEDKRGIATSLNNIGLIYMNQSDYSKALEYLLRSLEIKEEIGDKSGIASAVGNIGFLYFTLSQDSVSINPSELNEFVSINNAVNLNNAINYLIEAIQVYEEIGEVNFRSGILKNLADAYELKGDFKKALEATNLHHKLKDSVFNQEKTKEIANLTAQRELIEADRQAEKEAQIQAEKISRRNNIQYLSISMILLFLGFIMMLNGKIQMPEWLARSLVFVTFILLFEFILVVIDPITDDYSEGEPLVKLSINLAIAFILYPMHQFFSRRVTSTLLKRGGGSSIEKILNEFKSKKES